MSPERFLVDTTVWVKYLRGVDASLKNRISALVLEGRVFTSDIIIMEILRGAKSDKEYNMLYQDFLALPLLEIDHNVWETAWKTAYKLRKSGFNIPMADVIISAVAMYYKCTLMHSDKHFNLLAKHTGLNVIEV
ncbi:MAG: PIN domain nuclease [Nitrospirae bacterium]|nr:PIN domain nuclease [Nitrospirota bacterium]